MRLDEARTLLDEAEGILVLTGAGVSAESGVPTFRGDNGLWKDHRPEELATPQAFRRDPRLVWEWYGMRRELVGRCEPNRAHRALAELARSRPDARIVTQNVDGLHTLAADEVEDAGTAGVAGRHRSGSNPRNASVGNPYPLELHGSLFRIRCIRCTWSDDHREPVVAESDETLPRCPECGALARPAVVWFGESLDREVIEEAGRIAEEADVALVVGTSAVVHPAASLPRITASGGGTVIEVNPEETPLTRLARFTIRGKAGDILGDLV